jgi:translation initiation factor IF-2
MMNHAKKKYKNAPPATPVLIAGLSKSPQTGDILQVMEDEKTAREYSIQVASHRNTQRINAATTIGDLVQKIKTGEMKVLKVILKTDTKGSFEAIKQSLEKVHHDEVMIKIIHSGVGNIKESDIAMASASDAILLGFHVDIPQQLEKSIERYGVIVKNYKIIYDLIEDTKNLLSGLLTPEVVVVELGKAEVRQVFLTKKKEMIVGLKLTNGILQKGCKVRVLRKDEVVGEGRILTLQRIDKQVDEIKAENECGIKYTGSIPVEEGDILEAFKTEERQKTL